MNRGIFNEKLHQKFKIYSDLKVQEKALYGLQLKKWIKLKTKIIIKKYTEYNLHCWITSFLSLDTSCYIRHFSNMVHIKQKSRYFSRVIFNTFMTVFQTIGRTLCIPLAGVIFFFQGWRLDTILQFGILLLIGGLVVEMIPQFIDDYQGWRKRTGRATASIIVDDQPDDKKRRKRKMKYFIQTGINYRWYNKRTKY